MATIVGLGGLTGLALSAGNQKSASLAAKPLIRTKVIRRTIHVTKHVKPKNPVGAGAAGGSGVIARAGGTASRGSATTGASSAGSSPYSSSSAPVVTHTSGASAGSGNRSTGSPVVTHTSGSHTGSGGAPIVSHSSGSGSGDGGDGGGHGD